ncbi:hypothetical protein ACU686_16275 [Yinghuangia aomiensis]
MHIDVAEATEYYKTPRGAHPHGTNLWLFSSLAPTLGFDAYHLADKLLTQPLLLIAGNKPGEFGAYRDAHTVFDLAASKDKELLIIPDVSHYDLYDKPEAVQAGPRRAHPLLHQAPLSRRGHPPRTQHLPGERAPSPLASAPAPPTWSPP